VPAGVALSAYPAPLVAAVGAGHVVAAGVLFNADVAARTALDVLVAGPASIELFVVFGARFGLVPCLSTFEAHVKAALANHVGIALAPFNISFAVGSWTPSQLLVQIHLDVLQKLQEFRIHWRRTYPLHVRLREPRLTSRLWTSQFVDAAVGDAGFNVVLHTIQTMHVIAAESEFLSLPYLAKTHIALLPTVFQTACHQQVGAWFESAWSLGRGRPRTRIRIRTRDGP
jgi:hypothetical protein